MLLFWSLQKIIGKGCLCQLFQLSIISAFYSAVNYNHLNDNIWYNKQIMGNDRINTIMKRMSATAGLSGKKTNHSARKTMWLVSQKIIQLTGHKNLPSLNNYKKASLEQHRGRSTLSGWLGYGLTTFWGWHYIFMERKIRLWSHVYKHFHCKQWRKIMYYRQILRGVQGMRARRARVFANLVRSEGPVSHPAVLIKEFFWLVP